MARAELEAARKVANLSIESIFIPFSQSRDRDSICRSLNWKVTLKQGDRVILTTDYTAGEGHCPSYKQDRRSILDQEAIDYETQHGKVARFVGSYLTPLLGKPILPDSCDVLYSLAQDADVLNYRSFEDWANTMGENNDSRKAEALYKACLGIALQLKNGLGAKALEALQEAAQDY
jgi:hypothetical protein